MRRRGQCPNPHSFRLPSVLPSGPFFLWLWECRPPAPFSLRSKDSRLLPLLSQTQESGPPTSFIPRIQEFTPQTPSAPKAQESQQWETDTEEEQKFRMNPHPINRLTWWWVLGL